MDVTRERISRILEPREIHLSFPTGFSLVNAAVVCAILESICNITISDAYNLALFRLVVLNWKMSVNFLLHLRYAVGERQYIDLYIIIMQCPINREGRMSEGNTMHTKSQVKVWLTRHSITVHFLLLFFFFFISKKKKAIMNDLKRQKLMTKLLAEGKACKAIFWLSPGVMRGTFDS